MSVERMGYECTDVQRSKQKYTTRQNDPTQASHPTTKHHEADGWLVNFCDRTLPLHDLPRIKTFS